MKNIYKLTHKRLVTFDVENGQEICDTKMLGFFSSSIKCKEAIEFYLQQPGFRDYPERFFVEEIVADVNDFNDTSGEFFAYVYYLTHEWYDGEYDHVSCLGYYSTLQRAEEAEKKYRLDPELIEYQDGFEIDEYEIDEMEWKEGFFIWEEKEI